MPMQVNLDALIPREDFNVEDQGSNKGTVTQTLRATDLHRNSFFYPIIRKPDFQRETANWTPEKIVGLVQSYLEGDLIPAVILWRAEKSQMTFVIDGAHRLSAIIAWINNDYGDGELSQKFYENSIPNEQLEAAKATRKLIETRIGHYSQLVDASQNQNLTDPKHIRYAKSLGTYAIQIQWVYGDSDKAEDSFFRINQSATPIDDTELQIIQDRKKPSAIATRAILRSGTGHEYWWLFNESKRKIIKDKAKDIYDTLFEPAFSEPIKTLDLPVAGKGYSADTVRLIFDFVNLSNQIEKKSIAKDISEDTEGSVTISYLENVKKIASKITGTNPGSLGLHPAIYFYSSTGKYQPSAFLATVKLIQKLDKQHDGFHTFTEHRFAFEEFLLKYKYFINQIVSERGSGKRSLDPLFAMLETVYHGLTNNSDENDIIGTIRAHKQLKYVHTYPVEDLTAKKDFTRDNKSKAYLENALKASTVCQICKARVHKNSITIDHIDRKEEGGLGVAANGQLAHPFCNTGFKERKVAMQKKGILIN